MILKNRLFRYIKIFILLVLICLIPNFVNGAEIIKESEITLNGKKIDQKIVDNKENTFISISKDTEINIKSQNNINGIYIIYEYSSKEGIISANDKTEKIGENMILLVVDTQRGCFNEKLYAFETVKENIKRLIAEARKNGVEVCYVQHDDGPGADLDKETPNYEIFDDFAPLPDEKRFEKNVNSAFHPMTGLSEYLKSKNEMEIITIGVSTDYCMDATVKCGFEQGFKIIIPAYANSTYDNPYFDKETAYKYFNEFMWPKRYAKAVSVEEAIEMMKNAAKKLLESKSGGK